MSPCGGAGGFCTEIKMNDFVTSFRNIGPSCSSLQIIPLRSVDYTINILQL